MKVGVSYSVYLIVSIAVMNTMTKSNAERKDFISAYSSTDCPSSKAETQAGQKPGGRS